MSELFLAEKERFRQNWARTERILKENRGRYLNKNDVLIEALDLLEAKLNAEKAKSEK
jgi:hypothetical protein